MLIVPPTYPDGAISPRKQTRKREVTARNRWVTVYTTTLDLRTAARETRAKIDRLVVLTGKGALDSFDSDSSTGGLTTRGPSAPRPPVDPPPRRPPSHPTSPAGHSSHFRRKGAKGV